MDKAIRSIMRVPRTTIGYDGSRISRGADRRAFAANPRHGVAAEAARRRVQRCRALPTDTCALPSGDRRPVLAGSIAPPGVDATQQRLAGPGTTTDILADLPRSGRRQRDRRQMRRDQHIVHGPERLSDGNGSVANTSSVASAIWPVRNAAISASSRRQCCRATRRQAALRPHLRQPGCIQKPAVLLQVCGSMETTISLDPQHSFQRIKVKPNVSRPWIAFGEFDQPRTRKPLSCTFHRGGQAEPRQDRARRR